MKTTKLLLAALVRSVVAVAAMSIFLYLAGPIDIIKIGSFLSKMSLFYGAVIGFITSTIVPKINDLRSLDGLSEEEQLGVSNRARELISGLWSFFFFSLVSAILGIASAEFSDVGTLTLISLFLFFYVTVCVAAFPSWLDEIEDFRSSIKLRALEQKKLKERLDKMDK